jgi:hypothetical protein
MYNHYLKEIASGRFPPGIELIFVDLPADIKQKVKEAKKAASQEVSR